MVAACEKEADTRLRRVSGEREESERRGNEGKRPQVVAAVVVVGRDKREAHFSGWKGRHEF